MRKTNKVLSLTVAGLMAFSTSAVTAFSVSAAEDVTDTKISDRDLGRRFSKNRCKCT